MQFSLFEKETNSILGAATYDDFRSKLAQSNCGMCPALCEGRHTIVVDRGNPASKIVLVGEAPGENEDIQGFAFVGRAGQLLDKIMTAIGLDTNRDTLILNVVKCRPPENRAPTPEEAKNCRPYLEWQLNFVKPAVIVLLGATAAKHFLIKDKDKNMADQVGQFFTTPDFPGTQFMLLYHPAYLLRDPRKKKDMWEHVKVLRRWLETQHLISSKAQAMPEEVPL